MRYALFGLIGVIVVASLGLALIFAQNNAELQTEAENLQAIASTSEFQSNYIQAQVNWLVTRQFPLKPDELTQTPAPSFLGTATAQADLVYSWKPTVVKFEDINMVKVPAGCFWMGSNTEDDDEKPVHEVCLSDFWIDQYEMDSDQLERFTGSEAFMWSWIEAYEICKLRGARLPTEPEWEYAARGTMGSTYSWGNNSELSSSGLFFRFEGNESWVGAYDMSGGNYREWVNTIYNQSEYPYPYATDDGRENTSDNINRRILRGGGSYSNHNDLRASDRFWQFPQFRDLGVGFRCARDG